MNEMGWFRRRVGLAVALLVVSGCGAFDGDDAFAPSPNLDRLNASANASPGPNAMTPGPETMNSNPMEPDPTQCTGPSKEEILASSEGERAPECPSCEDAESPSFALEDVQPISCGFGQTYGLDAYAGGPLLVTLLSAGCGYCQNQTTKLEQMKVELALEGIDIPMLIVNLTSQAERSDKLSDRCSFAVLQDTEEDAVWDLYQGKKDDIYIYGADGKLRSFFRTGDEPTSNLSTDEGYNHVREAIVEAVGG